MGNVYRRKTPITFVDWTKIPQGEAAFGRAVASGVSRMLDEFDRAEKRTLAKRQLAQRALEVQKKQDLLEAENQREIAKHNEFMRKVEEEKKYREQAAAYHEEFGGQFNDIMARMDINKLENTRRDVANLLAQVQPKYPGISANPILNKRDPYAPGKVMDVLNKLAVDQSTARVAAGTAEDRVEQERLKTEQMNSQIQLVDSQVSLNQEKSAQLAAMADHLVRMQGLTEDEKQAQIDQMRMKLEQDARWSEPERIAAVELLRKKVELTASQTRVSEAQAIAIGVDAKVAQETYGHRVASEVAKYYAEQQRSLAEPSMIALRMDKMNADIEAVRAGTAFTDNKTAMLVKEMGHFDRMSHLEEDAKHLAIEGLQHKLSLDKEFSAEDRQVALELAKSKLELNKLVVKDGQIDYWNSERAYKLQKAADEGLGDLPVRTLMAAAENLYYDTITAGDVSGYAQAYQDLEADTRLEKARIQAQMTETQLTQLHQAIATKMGLYQEAVEGKSITELHQWLLTRAILFREKETKKQLDEAYDAHKKSITGLSEAARNRREVTERSNDPYFRDLAKLQFILAKAYQGQQSKRLAAEQMAWQIEKGRASNRLDEAEAAMLEQKLKEHRAHMMRGQGDGSTPDTPGQTRYQLN